MLINTSAHAPTAQAMLRRAHTHAPTSQAMLRGNFMTHTCTRTHVEDS